MRVSPSAVSQAVAPVHISTLLVDPRSSTKGLTVHCKSFHAIGLKLDPKQWVSAWLSDSDRVQLKLSSFSLTLRPIEVAETIRGPVLTTDIEEEFKFHILLPLWSQQVFSVITDPTIDPESTPAACLEVAPPAPILGWAMGGRT